MTATLPSGSGTRRTSVLAGLRRQVVILRRLPDYFSFVAMSPLSAVTFLAIVRSVGRDDLGVNVLIGVSIITAWQTGLLVSGDTIARDRQMGMFELTLAAPVSLRHVILGRVAVAAAYAFLPFVFGFAAAWVVYGTDVISVERPGYFALVLLASWFALLGALVMMSPISVLSGRSTALFNGLSYPLFLLAGIVVPVEFLPSWIRPISSVLFMRWKAEGLRHAATGEGDLVGPLIGLLVTGSVMLVGGVFLIGVVLNRMRRTGKVTDA